MPLYDPTGYESHEDELHRSQTWKRVVRAATTANITLSGTQTIDGVACVAGDRVLVKNQTTGSQNGLWVVASGAWARAFDMDQDGSTAVPGHEIVGAVIWVLSGTTNGATLWYCTNTGTPTLGTTALTFAQFTGGGMTNPMTTTGDIIYSSSGSTPARLAVGGANTLLHGGTTPAYSAVLPADLDVSADNTTADASTGHHGLLPKLGGGTTNFLRADGTWAATPSGFTNPMTTAGDLIVGDTGGAAIRLAKGADNQVLTIDPTTHLIVWATPSSGFTDPTTTKGDLIVHGTSATRLGVGTNGQVLTADSTQTLGVKWAAGGAASPPGGVTGLWQWFAADNLTGLSDGDAVSVWPNAAPGVVGFDAIGVAGPVYKTSILNSLPIVRFNGSTQYFSFYSLALASTAFSFVIVFKLSNITPSYTAILSDATAGASGYFVKSSGKSALYVQNATNYDGSGAITFGTTNWNYVTGTVIVGSAATRRNASADGSYSGGGAPLWQPTSIIGAGGGIAGRFFTGDIAEILIYSKKLSSSEITSIESYITTKYGL